MRPPNRAWLTFNSFYMKSLYLQITDGRPVFTLKLRLLQIALVSLLSVTIGLTGALAANPDNNADTDLSSDKVANKDRPAVAVQVIEFIDFSSQLSLTGAIAAKTTLNLSFRAGGQVIERLAEVGQRVEAGQLLARIDSIEQQSGLRSAEAGLAAAKAQLVQARSHYNRQQSLLAQGFTTQGQFGAAQEALQRTQAAVAAAESQLGSAQDMMSYTQLHAPRAGVITARNIEAGQLMQAAQTAYVLAADGGRDAIFDVQESLAADAATAERQDTLRVDLSLISDPRIVASGHVSEVSPVVNARTGTVRVKVSLDNIPTEMALGAPVTGSLRLRPHKAVELPWSALTSDAGIPAVWVVDRETNRVSLAPVKILSFEREKLILAGGVEEGQSVVIRGAQMLGTGEHVDIITETMPVTELSEKHNEQ